MNEKLCRHVVRRRSVSWDDGTDEFMEHLPCEGCGTWTSTYEMHHRKFRSRGGLWVPSNVVLLCKVCHVDTTDERPRMAGMGYNVATEADPAAVPIMVWYVPRLVLLDDEGSWGCWDRISPPF